jgi:hypothetical protein
MIRKLFTIVALFAALTVKSNGGVTDSLQIRAIYDEVLLDGQAYSNLNFLCKNIGNRISGSSNAQKAVDWSYNLMQTYGFDTVWLQEIMVPQWKRGTREKCFIVRDDGHTKDLNVTALGGSVGSDGSIEAELIEVSSIEDLKSRNDAEIKGKIVFINQAMDQRHIHTGYAYSGCAGIRVNGASEAASKGALAVVIRSLSTIEDDFPHTGVMTYKDSIPKIPAVAVSVDDAILLHKRMMDEKLVVGIELNCESLEDVMSYNVIAEIKGSENPEKVIVVGGHLDSWDIGEGAHDDGAGVVQSIEVLRIFKELNIKPKHTIRCVLFMNEENGTRGARAYAAWAKTNENEVPWVAMESDMGGFSPRGFSVKADKIYYDALNEWSYLFAPYFANQFLPGYGGSDINKLEDQGTILIGYVPDSQRYFDLHHSENDVFENVNKRELHLGAATMAALIYLIDEHGLPEKIKD